MLTMRHVLHVYVIKLCFASGTVVNGLTGSYKSFKSKGDVFLIRDKRRREGNQQLRIILVLRKKNKKEYQKLEFYNHHKKLG